MQHDGESKIKRLPPLPTLTMKVLKSIVATSFALEPEFVQGLSFQADDGSGEHIKQLCFEMVILKYMKHVFLLTLS